MARREQFQFTVLELTALAVSFVATSTLVFLLGFYVGRQAAAEHAAVDESVARVPVGEAPADAHALPRGDLPPLPAGKPGAPAAVGKPAARAPVSPPLPPAAAALPEIPELPPVAADAIRTAPPGVPFTVQVLATRNHGEADSMVSDLKRHGYGAYLVAVDDAGGTWYRVRIGHFENAEAAKRMADRASRELGLTQAYVSPIYSNAR